MKRIKFIVVALLTTAFLAGPLTAFAAEKKKQAVKPYPLNTCVVSAEKFGGDMGDPYVFVHDGREVKLCCKECKEEFDKQPAKFVAKIDEAAKKVKAYPLKTCAASGEALGGDMGDPYVFIHEGREIKLCCKECKGDFDKNPAKFISKLDQATKKGK